MKKIDVCCFVYGDNFLSSLDQLALPSFVSSFNRISYNFEYNYLFYTSKKFKNKLRKIVSNHLDAEIFKICTIDDFNSLQRPWEISVWNTQLSVSTSDYFLILIPDNFYFSEYASNLLKKIKNNDLVIGLPPYICKDAIEHDCVNLHLFGFKDCFEILRNYAHPFYFGLIGNSQRKIKGYYQSFEQELSIDMFNNEIIVNINCAHPIAFSSENYSFDNLNFKTRLKKNIFKTSYLDSIFHISVDEYRNKLRLLKKNSANYFLDNIITFCQNFSDYPWEAFRTLSFKYSIKKNYNQRIFSEEVDLFYIIKDKKFIQFIKCNNIKIESIYDLYMWHKKYTNLLLVKPFDSLIISKNKLMLLGKIKKGFVNKLKSKIKTLGFIMTAPKLKILKNRLKDISFGKRSQEILQYNDQ